MSIRPAITEDLPTLRELAARMHAEAPAYQRWEYEPTKVAELLRNLVAGAGCLLVSEVDGTVVGGIAGICGPHWFSLDLVATDLALFVHPEHRNGTTAMRLVAGFVEWARLRGAKRVNLGITTGVHPDSTARLYLACGLQPAGQLFSKDF